MRLLLGTTNRQMVTALLLSLVAMALLGEFRELVSALMALLTWLVVFMGIAAIVLGVAGAMGAGAAPPAKDNGATEFRG